jgi:hypothetical protein
VLARVARTHPGKRERRVRNRRRANVLADPAHHADNQSLIRLHLTDKGARRLDALSELHLEELAHLAPTMHAVRGALAGAARPDRSRRAGCLWSVAELRPPGRPVDDAAQFGPGHRADQPWLRVPACGRVGGQRSR